MDQDSMQTREANPETAVCTRQARAPGAESRPGLGLCRRRPIWAKAAMFVVLVVLIDYGLYRLLQAGFARIEVGETGGMVNHARKARAGVLVVGSSRAWHHYDTDVLHDGLKRTVYNAGANGQGLPYMLGVVDLVLRNYQPALLIVDVDAYLLIRSDSAYDRVTVLAPYIDESEIIRELIYSRGPLERLKYLSKSFRYNSKPLSILRNLGIPNRLRAGYAPLDGTMDETAAARATSFNIPAQPPDAGNVNLLRDLIRRAKAAGTQVVMVNSPRYRSDSGDDEAYRPLFQELQHIAAAEGVPYLQVTLMNAPEMRDISLYADPAHLNGKGARVFTEVLVRRLGEVGVPKAVSTTSGRIETREGR